MWSMDYYTVHFDANGGTPAPESQVVLFGNAATEQVGVTMPDHTLEGWYNWEQRWDFASPVEQTLTLRANWTATAPQTYALIVVNGTGSGSYAAGAGRRDRPGICDLGGRFVVRRIPVCL